MIQCQKCGAQNNEESVHCCSCGVKLDRGIVCSKCGCIRIPQNATYCPTCGKSLEDEFFHLVDNSNSMTAYQDFLKKFPLSVYADKIKEKVDKIQKAELKEMRKQKREEEEKKKKRSNMLCFIFAVIFATIFIFVFPIILESQAKTALQMSVYENLLESGVKMAIIWFAVLLAGFSLFKALIFKD